MSVISKRFADELTEKEMRDAYRGAQTRTYLSSQIRALRNQRDWTQADLGEALGVPQSQVSRIESREYGRLSLTTLQDLASVFDVGLLVKFVPYETFLLHTRNLSEEDLQVPGFSRFALDLLTRDAREITLVQEPSAAAHASETAAVFSTQRAAVPAAPALVVAYGDQERDRQSHISEPALAVDQVALAPLPQGVPSLPVAETNASLDELMSDALTFQHINRSLPSISGKSLIPGR